jgi:hypothetical protein
MKYLFSSVLVFVAFITIAQQINIPRVDQMPDFPQPYHMRDWKEVARNYDTLVFNLNATGQFFPLASIFENTTNYPDHPALAIQSYVGTNSPPGKEAINILPAVVGATLVGMDKSNQNGINWPLYCEEYFNRRPEENVYLNGPVSSSGHDWWYETMPNVFFYQLNYFYPNTGDFEYQVTTIADRWLEAVYAMGGSTTPWEPTYMNYRAFKLSTMTPTEDDVKQPEAAGAIGWILYQAYIITGDDKYRIGAELCLDFLSNWDQNPSYEIQLPYGVYIAARMNAELGSFYNIDKMINWCFDKGELRGWGVIAGNWGGNDMDGLIGEVNISQPDYVFHMNSLEHVSALVPMIRYDDRYATAIGKWVLNAANASRFYYSDYLPDEMQDNEDWVSLYDPNSAIAYESLLEKDDGPYGTGDAMNGGWAETNLGLYGSSHVGVFGGIIEKTNIEGVLQLDLLATDYYGNDAYQTYLYFNPNNGSVQVEINLFSTTHDIYDAVSNLVILNNASGIVLMDIPPKSSIMAVMLPASSEITFELNKAYVNGIVIDYNAGQTVSNYPPRIKALSASDSVGVVGNEINIFCSAEDKETSVLEYNWTIDGQPQPGNESIFKLVPENIGYYQIICTAIDGGGLSDSDTIILKVVEKINLPPIIDRLVAENQIIAPDGSTKISCIASDANNDELTYLWYTTNGTIDGEEDSITFFAPGMETNIYVVCEVKDIYNASDIDSILILVRDPGQAQTGDLVAHFLFAGNAEDVSGNGNHGMVHDCIFSEDMHGIIDQAIKINISSSKVTVTNNDGLNFQDGLTVSYWININELFDRESYPVSHGNWTTRWKTSITDDRLRFTLNGSDGIVDIDSETILETYIWYHIVGLYNGMDCLVFINGELEGFAPYSGKISKTLYDLVIGQSLPDQAGYNYKGLMDNLRIYNYGISYEMVKEIYESEKSGVADTLIDDHFKVYPNPVKGNLHFELKTNPATMVSVSLHSMMGQKVFAIELKADQKGFVKQKLDFTKFRPGTYVLKAEAEAKIYVRKIIVSE